MKSISVENLPHWASGVGENLHRDESRWMIDMPFGPLDIRFVDRNDFGVLDHFVTTNDGRAFYNPMRVVDDDAGAEVIFTMSYPENPRDRFGRVQPR